MNNSRLSASFFEQNTVVVARELIGYSLFYQTKQGLCAGIVSETEAYTQEDPACHAYMGKKTKRNAMMFEKAGTVYIYLIYGMYYCLNIATESKGRGCAVLIRGLIPTIGIERMRENRTKNCALNAISNGPGKLMQAMGIHPNCLGKNIECPDSPLYFSRSKERCLQISETTRIGISKAKENLWRFCGA